MNEILLHIACSSPDLFSSNLELPTQFFLSLSALSHLKGVC